MIGRFWSYYERIGRAKKKKYRCLFDNCNYKLPTYQGIVTHIKRTHGEEIKERNRKAKEWREEQGRKRLEKIEEEREAKEFAEQELKEYKRTLPQREKQNRLEKERREREIKRKKKLWDEAQRDEEERRVREAKLWFLFLSELEKSDLSYQEKEFQLIIAEKIGPAWFIKSENFPFGGDNAMELKLMEAYVESTKKGKRPDSVSTMMIISQIRNIDKRESSRDNNFMDKMMKLQMMKMMTDGQNNELDSLQREVTYMKHQMQMQQMMNQ